MTPHPLLRAAIALFAVAGSAVAQASPLGPLPASWRGDLPGAGGAVRWQIDLAPDGTYQLRQTFLNRPAPNRFDDIGRWQLETPGPRLVLRGGREAPVFLQPVEGGEALRKLDLEGQPIRSGQNDRLVRLAEPNTLAPQLRLLGLFRYQADAPSVQLCATGHQLPVAMEGDYPSLEKAYLRALPSGAAGQPLLVDLEGLIILRPAAEESQGLVRTLVVKRFGAIRPGQGCPAELRGTVWRLVALRDGESPALLEPGKPVELRLAADQERVSGSGGCNRLMGGFQLQGERLRFLPLATTRMACQPAVMAFEGRYLAALAEVRRWTIDKRNLLLQDARGRTLLVYREEAPAPAP